ncbi:MAG TPA: type VII secretion protein EccCb [Terriglobales bacterium]|nr:type VII secretion protein EccCb [Terriglobales bacterium]
MVGSPGSIPEQLSVSFTEDHTIGDLAAALTAFANEHGELHLATAGGPLLDPMLPIVRSPLRHGDHLLLVESAYRYAAATPAPLELQVLSGAAAGHRLPLHPGRYSLGRALQRDLRIPDPSISRSPAWIAVDDHGVVVEHVEGHQDLRVGGQAVATPCLVPLGQIFEMGGALLTVTQTAQDVRVGRPAVPAPLSITLPPPPVQRGWRSIPAGGGSWRQVERAGRYRRHVQQVLWERLPALIAAEEAARRAAAPDACEIADRARLGRPAVWQRRRSDPDFLRLRLGWTSLPSDVQITEPTGRDPELVRRTLALLLAARPTLHGVPLTVELPDVGVLAIAGDATETAGLARWVVLQAASLHGPSELGIAAVVAGADEWSWLNWLPHTAPDGIESATRLVAAGGDPGWLVAELWTIVEERRAQALLGRGQAANRALLLVIEDECPGSSQLLEQVLDAPTGSVYVLQVGARPPASARAVVQVVAGRNRLRLTAAGGEREYIGIPDRIGLGLAGQIARDLSRVEEAHSPIGLAALVDAAGRSRAGTGRLDAPLGVDERGRVEVDLAAGPHALVTGTAEAARSALLVAWAASLACRHSPRWLNLVLVGGPELCDLRRLPHAVALPAAPAEDVIDGVLDALLAEAERRQQLLGTHGEREMRHLIRSRPDRAPAQLVVIVDRYDHLAGIRPQIEGKVARLAELGQAAGIHLVLGVQAGAEPLLPAIRASAGLRIDLDTEHRGQGVVSIANVVHGHLQLADPNHIPVKADGTIRVQPPGGCTDLSVLVDAAGTHWHGCGDVVWQPGLAQTAPRAPRLDARRPVVEFMLTVEAAGQPPRDVAVEIDPERSVGDLVTALGTELGIEAEPEHDGGALLRRGQVWLRADQTVRSTRLRTGDALVIGSRRADAGDPRPQEIPADSERRPDESGRIAFNRQPRPQPQPPDLGIAVPVAPERGQGTWRSLVPVGTGVLMGLVMGGSMYLATGPGRPPAVLLMSVGVTPLLALLTAIMPLSDVIRRRAGFRRASGAFREQVASLGVVIERAAAAEAAFLNESSPDPESLVERARTLDPRLWERRPSSPDWLSLRIGVRNARTRVEATIPDGGDASLRAEAEAEIERARPLPAVPMVVALAEAGPLGLHGDRRRTGGLARWLAVQLAVLHSPEELVIAAALPTSERQQWSWLRWLPHVHGRGGPLPAPRLVAGSAAARGLLHRLMTLLDDQRLVDDRVDVVAFLHEDAGLPRGPVARLLAHGGRYGVHVVWVAGRRHDLPGECRSAAGLYVASGACRPELLFVESNRTEVGISVEGLAVEQALEVARALAPVTDLSAGGSQAPVPAHAVLLDLLDAPGSLEAEIHERWAAPRDRLAVPIGVAAGGEEFVIDLRAEGPHLLVLGPSGSGKSELLRALVLSFAVARPPGAVSFLLIDHEGQGTFQDFGSLPHTAAVATYLDSSGAGRVVTALRSELNRRERALREAGVKDLATLEQVRPGLAPPNLVIVFDEFARLATELPDLMEAVRGVAQQGGRLGVHLALATRHPACVSSVIGEAIDLRVSLRATGSETPPGRALALRAEAATEFQAAFTGGRTRVDRAQTEIVVRELEFDGTALPSRTTREEAAAGGQIDMVRLASAVTAVAARSEIPRRPRVLPELSDDAGASSAASGSVALPQLLGIDDMAALDVQTLWRPRPLGERLRVPVGVTSLGQPMIIDLKEAAAGGAGPHGLVIGTSGSGKSELLRTLVTALAVTHSPDVLAFVLIDFKGGAAFAGLSALPHVAGIITNLQDDLSLIDRMQAAITGERNRRQEHLRRAGNVDKLSEYQRKRERGEDLEPLPYLLVVVDEFSELLTARPDFVSLFAMIGRVGRSLGMHLLFSSQQFEEGRLRGLEDNLGYRVALRTASSMASRTVLGVPDAFDLPKEPGWGYARFGPANTVRFRAALVSQPYGSPPPEQAADSATTLDVAVAQLRRGAPRVHQVWLPPLEVGTTLDGILGRIDHSPARGASAVGWSGSGQLRVPIGLVDKPAEQKQDLMTVDLTGHLLVVGASQTGKSTLLRTLLASAALTHIPREAQFYCIDLSGGALRTVAALPHVGSVCGRDDPERVRRTVEEVAALVARRERLFQDLRIDSPQVMRARRDRGDLPHELADVFLVIDNWVGLRQEFAELEDVIRDVIATRGPGYGVHLVLTASRWLEVRDGLRGAIGGRLELRLSDPAESAIDARAARSLGDSSRQYERRMEEQRQLNGITPRFETLYGRGITAGGLQFQAALPRIDGRAEILDLQQAFAALVDAVAAAWHGPEAPPIRVLPRAVEVRELPRPEPRPAGVPVAISEHDLSTVHLDLVGGDPHFVVLGDVESGKTTFLRTFVAGLLERSSPDDAQIVVIDYRRGLAGLVPPEHLLAHCSSEQVARDRLDSVAGSLGRRQPGPEVPADQLHSRTWWKSQAEVYVVVDDYELVATTGGGPLQVLYPLLPQARDLGFHLVLARSSGGVVASFNDAVLRRLRELRTPMLVLSGEPQEGALPGGHRMAPLPPGRGRLIRRREGTTFVQVATSAATRR